MQTTTKQKGRYYHSSKVHQRWVNKKKGIYGFTVTGISDTEADDTLLSDSDCNMEMRALTSYVPLRSV
jgi:hypothetical protein